MYTDKQKYKQKSRQTDTIEDTWKMRGRQKRAGTRNRKEITLNIGRQNNK